MTNKTKALAAAKQTLVALGLPRAQQNERSALCLLALLDLAPDKPWAQASNPLMGITPIMDWARKHYRKDYAPNTRETVRRQTMHQFVAAGLALYNPDKPGRPVNSPHAKYQIEPAALALMRTFGTEGWHDNLAAYLSGRETLAARYAMVREQNRVPVRIAKGKTIALSPGEHSELIRAIVEDFASCFAPGSVLVYVGDTGEKWGSRCADVGQPGRQGRCARQDAGRGVARRASLWLLLVESVTSHGPVDGKRHAELTKLFGNAVAGLVYITAFPSRAVMARYLGAIACETEVWRADAPSHLIHFNGERFLGPYGS